MEISKISVHPEDEESLMGSLQCVFTHARLLLMMSVLRAWRRATWVCARWALLVSAFALFISIKRLIFPSRWKSHNAVSLGSVSAVATGNRKSCVCVYGGGFL